MRTSIATVCISGVFREKLEAISAADFCSFGEAASRPAAMPKS
jgi:hypothetical protein